ncbi:MAG: hypothetical protein R3C05_29520 [Pirellulaceae bacterium]
MLVFQQYVHRYFGREALMHSIDSRVRGVGDGLIDQDAAVDDMVMTDVLPFHFGC